MTQAGQHDEPELTMAELTALVRRQQAEIDALKTHVRDDQVVTSPVPTDEEDAEPAASRRGLLKLAGAAAAGAAVATVGPASRAAATDGDPVLAARSNTATVRTKVVANGAALDVDHVFGAADFDAATVFPAALGGEARGAVTHNGVHGSTESSTTNANTGHGMIARRVGAARSNIYLVPEGGDPNEDTNSHSVGEVRASSDGTIWGCWEAGTPGRWDPITGPNTPTAENVFDLLVSGLTPTKLVEPFRVYDSRFSMAPTPSGRLGVGQNRVVPIRDKRAVADGTVDVAEFVPSNATGIVYTISTIAPSGPGGFLSVGPLETTTVGAATINFDTTSPTVLNNTGLVQLGGDREIRVICGGAPGSSTDFVIDIVGLVFDLGSPLVLGASGTLQAEFTSAAGFTRR